MDEARRRQMEELARRGRAKREASEQSSIDANQLTAVKKSDEVRKKNPFQNRIENKVLDAMKVTAIEDEVGIEKENESSFKRNFRRSFAKYGSRGLSDDKLAAFRSDGKVFIDKEYVRNVRNASPAERKQEVSGLAAFIKERMISLQGLINEKGLYTGQTQQGYALDR